MTQRTKAWSMFTVRPFLLSLGARTTDAHVRRGAFRGVKAKMVRPRVKRAKEPIMHAEPPRSMLAKASDILGASTVEHPVLSQAEITRRANLPHSTTRR